MVKHTPNNLNRILFRIDPLENIQREYIIREQDLPPGSLLFIKHGERVYAKQLVAQASHVKLTKQRLPSPTVHLRPNSCGGHRRCPAPKPHHHFSTATTPPKPERPSHSAPAGTG